MRSCWLLRSTHRQIFNDIVRLDGYSNVGGLAGEVCDFVDGVDDGLGGQGGRLGRRESSGCKGKQLHGDDSMCVEP